MDNLRDLVSGQGCDDGTGSFRNPLTKFVDHMLRDKSQRENQEWQRQQLPQLNNSHEPTLSTHTGMAHREITGFLDNFANDNQRTNTFDPLQSLTDQELGEVSDFMNGGHRGLSAHVRDKLQISPQVPPDLVREYLDSLANGPQQETYRPIHVPGEMHPLDKMAHSDALMRQMDRFPPPMHREFDPDHLVNEFNNMHLQPHSFEDMERFYRESQLEDMANQFTAFQHQQDFEKYYTEANETERWIDEFEGNRPIERLDDIHSLAHAMSQINDPKLQSSNFMKFINKINTGEVDFVDNQLVEKTPADTWADEFEKAHPIESQADVWANEFHQNYPPEESLYNNSWLNEYDDFETDEWLREYSSVNQLKDYQFTDPAENPYVDHPSPFAKGMELFNDGRLAQSILAFEAELLKNPQNSKGWEFLGKAHAENDKDGRAISALLHAIDVDPSNLDAYMALAVSYTNDLYRDQALDILKKWVERHSEYNHIKMIENEETALSFDRYHKGVTDLFINVARLRPNDPDPDVQTALGLLFNLNLEYDKAVDCFKAALTVRPEDYQLWNKLGATLANSNRSQEAIGCYFNALKFKPSYVRARANLGISFMALQEYEKAATYFLGALSMHPKAKHIWSNLHMVFLSMGREDLVQRSIENEGNVEVFRDSFEF